MATANMIDDRLQIDGFDPYTWSNTFGVHTGGFRKDTFMNGGFSSGMDETPMEEAQCELSTLPPASIYLKTTGAKPTAPYTMYPARKYEYSDGRVTWERAGLPWIAPPKDLTILWLVILLAGVWAVVKS